MDGFSAATISKAWVAPNKQALPVLNLEFNQEYIPCSGEHKKTNKFIGIRLTLDL